MPTQPRKLPSGRHGLPRSFVARNQRERILVAVADVVFEKGYQAMTVEDIVQRSGVSRHTFYEQFPDKCEAFFAAYDAVKQQCIAVSSAAFSSSQEWPEQVRLGLGAFLSFLANDPAFTRMGFVEIAAAGSTGLARRNSGVASFELFLTPGLALTDHPVPDTVVAMIAGGIFEMVYARVLGDHIAELPELLPAVVYHCLCPFVGLEVAAREADLARAELGG
jgi:AcrR family transcriptional regulator